MVDRIWNCNLPHLNINTLGRKRRGHSQKFGMGVKIRLANMGNYRKLTFSAISWPMLCSLDGSCNTDFGVGI